MPGMYSFNSLIGVGA